MAGACIAGGFIFLVFALGCLPAPPQGSLEVARQHLDATAKADVEAVARTLHPQSPAYATLLDGVRKLEGIDMRISTEELRWRGKDAEGRVMVEVRQFVEAQRPGHPLTHSRVRGRILLVPQDRSWKVWNVEVLDVDFLPVPSEK